MDFTTFLWATFGVFVTLATLSFLYKDNPFYKFAEHLVVGVSAGYFVIILWHTGLVPKLFERLADGHWYYGYLDASGWFYVIPALLGIMMWTRFSKNYAWVSRWPLALYIGIASGLAIPLEMSNRVNKQLVAMMTPIDFSNFFGHGGFNLLDVYSGLSQVLIIIGTLTAIIYFFFSKEHTGAFGGAAKLGIWVLMIGFGASFGYTVMARISLFINRLQDAFDWGHVAFDRTNENWSAWFLIVFWAFVLFVVGYIVFEIIKYFTDRGKEAPVQK
ncbi:MAG TPA: hypothetical protein PLF13_12125 [candidate division Zixibacteria bacterium]|nr:hypothetical protein [candidate division Zixibacteria bacterium]